MRRDKANSARLFKYALRMHFQKEKDMRIICDHCGHPVSGTVKRVPGNLNLHPECFTRLGNESNRELAAVSWRSGESSVSMLVERKGNEGRLSPDDLNTTLRMHKS